MDNYQILSFNEVFSIVIREDAKEFTPLILKGGQFYDTVKFRPIDPKPKQKCLTEEHKAMANKALLEAEEKWKGMQAKKAAELEKQKAQLEAAKASAKPSGSPSYYPPVPSKPAQTQTPQSTLDSLISEAVAKIAVGSVMDSAKPVIDDYIKTTYGMIPKVIEVKSQFGTHDVKGMTAQEFETVLPLVTAGIPVFLSGPAGCGKNVMCKQVAEALGLQFYFSNAVTQEYKITGFIDANGKYQGTQFHEAFVNGGVFMLDEIDASSPEVLVLLNAAIANGYFDFPTGRVSAHKDFRIVAAGNTYGTGADVEYTGRYQLDASSLDRFCIVDVTYDRNIEEHIAGGDKEMLKFIWDFRKAVKKAAIHFTVSYRAIDRLSKMINLFDTQKAVKLAILRGMEQEDAKMVANNMHSTDKYTAALKACVCN